MLNKNEILKLCLLNFEKQVHDLEVAAKASAALATDEEHRARSKYETFSLETSYLARGQARRVAEIREAYSRLSAFEAKPLPSGAKVQIGALVEVKDAAGEKQLYFLVPAGGGEEVGMEGRKVLLVTLQSPVAQSLLKNGLGDSFIFAGQTLHISAIW